MTQNVKNALDSIPISSIPWDSSWPKWLSQTEQEKILCFWNDRFGVSPRMFCNYLLAASTRTVYLISKSYHLTDMASIKINTAGIPFIRNVAGYLKPTTWAVQRFGSMATRHVVTLTDRQLYSMIQEGEIQIECKHEQGYVIIKNQDKIWGCSLFLKPDRLLCRLPKVITNNIC